VTASNNRLLPPLHVVTNDVLLARSDFPLLARRVLSAGGRRLALHLRGHATSGERLYGIAARLKAAASAAGAFLFANDRVDVAMVTGLDGVHLGQSSMAPAVVRPLLRQGTWVGVSVHDPEEAQAAAADADYLVVGTVFATASHPGRTGSGSTGVARVRAGVGLPLFATGGVTAERVTEVVAAGVQGVAVLRGIWSRDDPATAVEDYLRVL
jgi:thiamine-phosphate diphosphorylase